jgi:hypothetical protein
MGMDVTTALWCCGRRVLAVGVSAVVAVLAGSAAAAAARGPLPLLSSAAGAVVAA